MGALSATSVKMKSKKAVNTRWLSLYASVDGVFDEYVGLWETFSKLETERGTGESMAKGFSKTLKSPKFTGMVYILRIMLPPLVALSKTFQISKINFSKV